MITFKPYMEYRMSLDDLKVSDVFWMITRYISDPDVVNEMDGYVDYKSLCDIRTYSCYQMRHTDISGTDVVVVDFGKKEGMYQYTAEILITRVDSQDIINVHITRHDKNYPDQQILTFSLSDEDDEYDGITMEIVDYMTYREGGALERKFDGAYYLKQPEEY